MPIYMYIVLRFSNCYDVIYLRIINRYICNKCVIITWIWDLVCLYCYFDDV
jgi:hypothetical protein